MNGRTERSLRHFAEAWWTKEVLPSIAEYPNLARQRDVQTCVELSAHRHRTNPNLEAR